MTGPDRRLITAVEASSADHRRVCALGMPRNEADARTAREALQALVLLATMLGGMIWASGCGNGAAEPAGPPPDPPRATTVTVTPSTAELAALGATVQLTAGVRDQNGNAMSGAAVSWSSSATAVASVDGTGLVAAAGNGSATITATAGPASGSAQVTVAQEVSSVTVSPAADTLALGDTLRLNAEAADANGHAVVGAKFDWVSQDTLVAVVDSAGLVTGIAAGDVAVTATSSGVTGGAALTVVAPTTVAVTPDTVVFTAIGDTARFTAQVRDQNGNVMLGAAVTWASTDSSVASVTDSGLARADGDGTATITANAGPTADSATVAVRRQVVGVVVSPDTAELEVGDTLRLTAEAQDANGNPMEGSGFVWMSGNEYVATVDSTGLVQARVRGDATITAALGTLAGRANLTVALPFIPPNLTVDEGTSHSLQFGGMHVRHPRFAWAIAYADLNGDNRIDIFYSPLDGTTNAVPAEVYINNGVGGFYLDAGFFGADPPGGVHPRKALVGDFNGDGKPDVFVLDSGYDRPPWPGAPPYAVLSSATGYVKAQGLDNIIGYHHGGASADIDADGDLDVFVTESLTRPFFLVNDGAGNFTWDASRVEGIEQTGIFTAELVDVDRDGYVDLLVAGHEFQDFSTQILWGDNSGVFSTLKASILPPVRGRGIVLDIDVADTDGDGDKDVVLNRTGADYTHGYHVQLLEQTTARTFVDKTTQLMHANEDTEVGVIRWLRIHDIDEDGDPDIFADEASRQLIWKNNGSGEFRLGLLRVVPPNHAVDEGTSHTLQKPPFRINHSAVRTGRPSWTKAFSYADFDNDGDTDIFYAPRGEPSHPLPAELYVNDGHGNFSLDAGFLDGTLPTLDRAAKALPGDYNGDGRPDVFVISDGGGSREAPYAILSSGDTYTLGPPLHAFAGAYYAGASADVDADGDVDVFVTDPPSFLLNDGSGSFRAGIRVEGLHQFLNAAELVDVDSDGYADLLVGGHEFEGDAAATQIIWGDSTGIYTTARRTVLPAVAGHGVILDIDVGDTDGDRDGDIVITRTGDDTGGGFHEGYYVQLVENAGDRQFRDVTSALLPANRDDQANSFNWIRLYDVDGDSDIDIVVDAYAWRDLVWKNDGTGSFQRDSESR